jgi:putative restriction endonuclease
MTFWLCATDPTWYENLKGIGADEANLWKSGTLPPCANAAPGTPFLFRVNNRTKYIVGGGFFVTQCSITPQLAWDIFDNKNGYPTRHEFIKAVNTCGATPDPQQNICCTVLANTRFFDRLDWIEGPSEWDEDCSSEKFFDANDNDGQNIWRLARTLLVPQATPPGNTPDSRSHNAEEERSAYGQERIIRPRLGQSAFRLLVTDAYMRRCAITGEKTLVTLEAAHIVPYAMEQTHDVKNGLLLRADFHRLFDVGLVGISPELKIRISPKIREDWFNGKAYYRLDGHPMTVIPENRDAQPDRDRLKWHMENVYQG